MNHGTSGLYRVLGALILSATAVLGAPSTDSPIQGDLPVAAGAGAVGRWLPPRRSPIVAIHSIVLPTGKVLQFGYPRIAGAGGIPPRHVGAEVALFDPKKRRFTELVSDEHDIFCAGHSFLADGRVFITGGFDPSLCAEGGIPETHFFDAWTETFEEGPRMKEARYYPSNLTLGDGSVLVFSGYNRACVRIGSVEILKASDPSRMRPVKNAGRYIRLYPAVFLLPDGRVVNVGPDPITRVLEPGVSEWQNVAVTNLAKVRHHSAAFQVPGDPWKIMICGGYEEEFAGPTRTCEMIDLSEPKPTWHATAPMRYGRGHLNTVILPDKTVMVVGGGQEHDYEAPVRAPELYDPAKDAWTLLPVQRNSRIYHSTAVLLPDGSVMSAGQDEHRLGFNIGKPEAGEAYEIYEPAYLHKGKRPRILSVPETITYGETFAVEVKGARRMDSVVLMTPGAVTHSTNMTQRLVDVPFHVLGAKVLELEAPEQPNLAPPGYYMLFVLDKKGVPSEASMIRLDAG